jgi:hypothetical protein
MRRFEKRYLGPVAPLVALAVAVGETAPKALGPILKNLVSEDLLTAGLTPILVGGALALMVAERAFAPRWLSANPKRRWAWLAFLAALTITAFGSAYVGITRSAKARVSKALVVELFDERALGCDPKKGSGTARIRVKMQLPNGGDRTVIEACPSDYSNSVLFMGDYSNGDLEETDPSRSDCHRSIFASKAGAVEADYCLERIWPQGTNPLRFSAWTFGGLQELQVMLKGDLKWYE